MVRYVHCKEIPPTDIYYKHIPKPKPSQKYFFLLSLTDYVIFINV